MSGMLLTGGMTMGGMVLDAGAPPPGPSMAWDPNKFAWNYFGVPTTITLSNNNLTASRNNTAGLGGQYIASTAISTYGIQPNTKSMFSVSFTGDPNGWFVSVGFVTLLPNNTNNTIVGLIGYGPGNEAKYGIGITNTGDVWWNYWENSGSWGTGQPFNSGATIDAAVDTTTNSYRFYWRLTGGSGNGLWNSGTTGGAGANPVTGSGAILLPSTSTSFLQDQVLYPAISLQTTNTNATQFTINSTPGGAIPAGYTFVGGAT